MGGSDDSDDDVPVSRLRGQRGDPPHSAAYRDSRKRTSEASDPSRAEKQPAVGYTAAKAGAELVAAELKRAQQLRDGAPASRQCADYVLERIRAVPEHAWFAEPARRPRASNSGPPRAVPPDEPDAVTTRWLEALEGIRHLKTNSGNPIRDGVLVGGATAAPRRHARAPSARRPQAALEITTNAAVAQFLRRCLAWWRCNAAGTTSTPRYGSSTSCAHRPGQEKGARRRRRGASARSAAAGAAERFAEARSLHADDAPRPAAPPPLGRVRVRRRRAPTTPQRRRRPRRRRRARRRGRARPGRRRRLPRARRALAWADGDAVDPPPRRTSSAGRAASPLPSARRLGALARGAARAAAVAAACDARADACARQRRRGRERRGAAAARRYEREAFDELEAGARRRAEERRRGRARRRGPLARSARSGGDDKVRGGWSSFADAAACGCGPGEALVVCGRDRVRGRELRETTSGKALPRRVAAVSDCEASASLASSGGAGGDAAHVYARRAWDQLRALRRHALAGLERALDAGAGPLGDAAASRRRRRCEAAHCAGRFPSDGASPATRWVLDALRKGRVALRDARDALGAERSARRARVEIINASPVRGYVLGTDRLRRAYVSLERGLDHDSRVWCLPSEAGGGPWCQVEGPANLRALRSRLDARGTREALLREELAVLDSDDEVDDELAPERA
ncbi:hypothetical protein JL720_6230 [Aureococcus anophagefferens]|nr:hypothetical protein JL720_6230 [Aureococcus anophagefferens]